jgi:hypothetical protein
VGVGSIIWRMGRCWGVWRLSGEGDPHTSWRRCGLRSGGCLWALWPSFLRSLRRRWFSGNDVCREVSKDGLKWNRIDSIINNVEMCDVNHSILPPSMHMIAIAGTPLISYGAYQGEGGGAVREGGVFLTRTVQLSSKRWKGSETSTKPSLIRSHNSR